MSTSVFGPENMAHIHWVNFTGAGSASDSFNNSSISDPSTGAFSVTMSQASDSDKYCISYCGMDTSAASSSRGIFGSQINSTSQYTLNTRNPDGNEKDQAHNMTSVVGGI